MYDFRRKRPTHIKKGLASIDYNCGQGVKLETECRQLWQPTEVKGLDIVKTHNALRVERLTANSMSKAEPVQIDGRGNFEVLMGIEGALKIVSLDDKWTVSLSKGRSLLIPSHAGSYEIHGLDRENENRALRISMKIPGENGER